MAKELMKPSQPVVGFCNFCRQGITIEADDEYWSECGSADEIATLRCNCDKGTVYRIKARRKEDAREKINENVPDESLKRIMLNMVDPLVDGEVRSFAISRDGCKVGLRLNKEGRVRINVRNEQNVIIE